MTSMQTITGRPLEMDAVKDEFARQYSTAKGEGFVRQESPWPLLGKR